MSEWFKKYWPWIIPGGLLVGEELFFLYTQLPGGIEWMPTLSQLVWRASAENPWLIWPATIVTVVLWLHFFLRRLRS